MSSYEQALYYRDMDMNDGQTERYTPEVLDIIKMVQILTYILTLTGLMKF